jgi:hypothetical protein
MANYDLRKDGTTNFPTARPRTGVLYRKVSVNTSNYSPTSATNGGFMLQSVGAGDTVQIMNIPAGTFVSDIRVEVLTVGTGNLSVGDSGSATQWVSAQSLGSTGFVTMAATSKFYSAADYVKLTYVSANDGVSASQTPVIKVTVEVVDHTDHPPATTAVL